MFGFKDSADALDLSKTAVIKNEHLAVIKNEHLAAQLMVWNQLALDLSHSTKMEHETTYDSGSYSGSEHSKESLDLNTTNRCNSSLSSESTETHRSRKHRERTGKPSVKDDNYYERRRKNNMAAKKSRDAKRMRENQMKQQMIILKDENLKLRAALSSCRCSPIQKAATVFLPTYTNFPVSYREPQYIPVATNLRS